ncbi:MAG TPA: ABC transporter substrate-binding protein [Dehalococcoidia bacterium]|nr:ABC transporter substrate-binding protein [Dehalococcoidia bacterium]
MIGRRQFVATLGLGVLTAPLAGEAQPAGKIARVGVLYSSRPLPKRSGDFFDSLRELGWVEGQNIMFEVRSPEDRPERLPELAAELVRLKVDVIMAFGPYASHSAKEATQTIPIVFTAADPVRRGLVASLRRPGGNLTGLTNSAENMTGKPGELLKELVPRAERIAYLINPANPVYWTLNLEKWRADLTGPLRVSIQMVEARSREELAPAVEIAVRARAHGLVVTPDTTFFTERRTIVDLAAKHRLPTMYGSREAVEDGGLMSYGTSNLGLRRRAASYVDKILKGAKPADLPVEQPTKFELVINMRTAKALGLTVPPSLLVRADEVIE